MTITLPKYDCSLKGHVGKVLEWGYDLIDGQMHSKVIKWGCTKCDASQDEPWEDFGQIKNDNTDHIDSDSCVCFGCKARTLQLSPGDAAGNKAMSQKKWDAELNAYASARKQGIQPAGTTMAKVQDALEKSDKAGKAYDANTGGFKG